MKIKAQIAMVINLDKCIGCHTCSVTCKNTWTNRGGTEYIWFNNVETKPGIGYPKRWEDQDRYKGGWTLKRGKLDLKSGNRLFRLANIFHNPNLPVIDDYYEPWTYDYEKLTASKKQNTQPVARPKSQLTGNYLELNWGPNWEDDLAGATETGPLDPNLKELEEQIRFEFEEAFMLHLPRICEHCLNPACVASCPSGAIYKRDEDGIVLVDQEMCRGWRFCVTGCPYKKVYFNWQTHKAEKCTLCYPRVENGQPTVCSETCTGRVRYMGVILYDADQVAKVASTENEQELYQAQLELFLDPHDPEIIEQARKDGISEDWLKAAQKSPVYKLAIEYALALPLHPEYRTLPMVWYIPPLSPISGKVQEKDINSDILNTLSLIDEMRIPLKYLANLLTAGDEKIVAQVLKKIATMRQYMRAQNLGQAYEEEHLIEMGLTKKNVEEMYRLLAIAKYEDRFVIPATHKEEFAELYTKQGSLGYDFGVDQGGK
ncbi:MAG: nitrate reductase subunit beta [Bacillota bacterium]